MDTHVDGLRYAHEDNICCRPTEGKTQKRNPQNPKEGSYGVSIRVQGIDGHPYIVLNNKDRRSKSNISASDTDLHSLSRHLHNLNDTQSTERNIHENLPVPENPYGPFEPSTQYSGSSNGKTNPKQDAFKTTNLLNFQRNPELLKPYIPGENHLSADNYQSSVKSQNANRIEEDLQKESSNLVSSYKWQPTKNTSIKSHESSQFVNKETSTSSTREEDQNKLTAESTSVLSSPSETITYESFSTSSGSPPSSSCVPVEAKKTRPDVLQFRRQDSAGPVLEGLRSRRSSCSSTATSSQSLQRLLSEEQEDALYADNVNRHENRRYIPFVPGTGRDIDTGCIPAVDELIEMFDSQTSPQRRGRSAKRNRIHPEDRKRARSVDSALPFGLEGSADYLNEFSKNLGKSNEHLLKPSQICAQKTHTQNYKLPFRRQNTTGRLPTQNAMADSVQKNNFTGSLQYPKDKPYGSKLRLDETDSALVLSALQNGSKENGDIKSSTSSLKLQSFSSATAEKNEKRLSAKKRPSSQSAQVTPDLLKGQQQLAQQTHEETAKQILYNYLKEGSPDNDDATKRKVNLVFEKIQTLKSRASNTSQVLEPPPEVKSLTEQKLDLEKKLSVLQKQVDEQRKKQENHHEEKSKTKANMKDIQEQLEKSMDENLVLREKLGESEKELRKHLEELFELKMEQEQYQTEIRDLQEQLSEMHDELDNAKSSVVDGEREALIEELLQMKQGVQELLLAKEEQEDLLRKRERELTALKGALKDEVSTHDQEIDRLKEQYDKELKKLRTSLEEAVENSEDVTVQKNEANRIKSECENRLRGLLEENEALRRKIQQLEAKIAELHTEINEINEDSDRLREKLKKSEKEKQQLAEALEKANDQVKETSQVSRKLENQLEDLKRNFSRITHEHQQLAERLKDESNQKEHLRNLKNEMENERWHLDKTIEKLQKEVTENVEFSRTNTVDLQKQFDEYRDKHRRDTSEIQRQLNDKTLEVEKSSQMIRKLQDEVRHLEENLQDQQRAHDEALTKNHLLQQTIKDLQYELDAKAHIKDDRVRQIKSMEDKILQLEMELDEEKNNSDLLLERITRCREQIEQTRGELLQERAARQDLECDKMSLERQNKDLRSRIAHLENSHRSNKEGLVAQMEARIAELEERLENEERDRANLQLSNRRLERKVKELMMQVDDEHLSLTDQKDQLSLRLKSMKRQVEQAEEEIDRLESAKKKLQRDLEEQVDLNDQIQSQLTTAKKELSRRKNSTSKILNDLEDDDDDVSTDGDSLYDAPSMYKFSRDDAFTA